MHTPAESTKIIPPKDSKGLKYKLYQVRWMYTWWWFQIFFIFTPKTGEDEPILTSIFFKWVGSTTNQYLYSAYCEYKLGYIRLDWCNIYIYIYIYSAYNTPLIQKITIISIWNLSLDVDVDVTPGRTLLLPMARLPSSTVAQTLVKGLQVASQQGAIPVRCFFMAGSTYPTYLHPPTTNPPISSKPGFTYQGFINRIKRNYPPQTNSLPLNMDGWKTMFFFLECLFSGVVLVSGSVMHKFSVTLPKNFFFRWK